MLAKQRSQLSRTVDLTPAMSARAPLDFAFRNKCVHLGVTSGLITLVLERTRHGVRWPFITWHGLKLVTVSYDPMWVVQFHAGSQPNKSPVTTFI